jgi:hypothetical protein
LDTSQQIHAKVPVELNLHQIYETGSLEHEERWKTNKIIWVFLIGGPTEVAFDKYECLFTQKKASMSAYFWVFGEKKVVTTKYVGFKECVVSKLHKEIEEGKG